MDPAANHLNLGVVVATAGRGLGSDVGDVGWDKTSILGYLRIGITMITLEFGYD